MKVKNLNALNTPWAIRPDKLIETNNLYRAHIGEVDLSISALEKNNLLRSAEQHETYSIINDTAVIDIGGVLFKDLSVLSWLLGCSSMREIGNTLRAALEDSAVQSIILSIDSPGGTVDGTEELAGQIFAARGKKPIIAYSDGMITSAAYWIASAADKIYISGDTNQVGSIGIVAAHIDISAQEKMNGEKITEITAGKYKRLAGQHTPLSDEGRTYLQEQVDNIYQIFIKVVARNRNISERQALNMADGKIFLGQQAVGVGLVDGVATFADVLKICAARGAQAGNRQSVGASKNFENLVADKYHQGAVTQNAAFSFVKLEHPALYADFRKRQKTGNVAELFPGQIIGGKMQH